MTCASVEDLFAFVQRALPTREAEAVRQHLTMGCEECNKRLRQIQKMLSITDAPGLLEPPDWLTAEAMKLLRQQSPSRRQGPGRGIQAVLLVDTGAQGRLLGFRGAGPTCRHMLYRAGDYDIDLSMDYAEQTRLFNMIGQSMPLGKGLDSVANSDVELLRDSIIALATRSNELGEFILDGIPEGIYDMKLKLKEEDIDIVELKALTAEF